MSEYIPRQRLVHAFRWSLFTEIVAKLLSPITNMVLARILAPEAFGAVATVTMIVSFADMFTDAGFQKYLVQHEFETEDELASNATVAFWTNLSVSVVLWLLLFAFSETLASAVGSPGLGLVISVASAQLICTAFSSIHMAMCRRRLNFRRLFFVRVVSACVPLFVTIPLAFLGMGYWSLVLGTMIMQLSNALLLSLRSSWRPTLHYSVAELKGMLSFSIWSLVEAVSIWLTAWIDAFIIGTHLNQMHLGLYKTSVVMVNSIMALVAYSIMPVLFSALSRLQHDHVMFMRMYFRVQRIVALLVLPMGLALYVFRDLATSVLLGSQWSEASGVVGTWSLTSSILIVLGYFSSEVYRAKGRPQLSVLAQILHLVVLIPTCLVAVGYGFWPLVYARSWVRMQAVLVDLLILKRAFGVPVLNTFRNVLPAWACALGSAGLAYFLGGLREGLGWDALVLAACGLFYIGLVCALPASRAELSGALRGLAGRGYATD